MKKPKKLYSVCSLHTGERLHDFIDKKTMLKSIPYVRKNKKTIGLFIFTPIRVDKEMLKAREA